ncbi:MULTISPECIES: Rho termination factor N-terminal domain-containing protein [unclassified Fusibacter]|uniref:Rho termination factor N-terminal domain-containing protein n=1 Tax=unclassified Fusibacter TaxID=2624464 RepID=UPI0010137BDA|nr:MULTISPECIES: Rho termination factor N-terminal domain-containing protein [unclassified Fusibacter]MCK8059912.1 SEC-C domain-containing protein [Fusibacter sp. A2]NPE22054.1 hypothetical protein [Fusibacter sp. A1]RXV60834.1 hypothetical protein DWB64_09425 [Fusibacter sp. A1]
MNEKMIRFGAEELIKNKKALEPTMNYTQMLSRYTLNDLKQIAEFWSIKVTSAMRKNDLVQTINDHVCSAVKIEELELTSEAVNYLKTYLTQTGERTTEMATGAAYLRALGIVFTGTFEDRLIEIIPGELSKNLANMVGLGLQNEDQLELAALLDTIVIYHGALTFNDVVAVVRSYTTLKGNDQELLEKIHHALHFTRLARKSEFLLAHGRVKNPQSLYEAVLGSDQTAYAKISPEYIAAVKKKQSPAFSIHHDRLKQFLGSVLQLDPVSAHLLMDDMMIKMNLDWQMEQIISDLDGTVKFEHPEQRNGLVQLLGLVYQHTPKWLEKGHTPHELYIPKEDTKPDMPQEKPKQVVNTDKIGRNDPCACGSGKKYKKCCL